MSRFNTDGPTEAVLADVGEERERQLTKWGPQHHGDGSGPDKYLADFGRQQKLFAWWRDRQRALTDDMAAVNATIWSDILLEEVFEACAESDPTALRKELVQVAAVAVAWVEDIDTRTEAAPDANCVTLGDGSCVGNCCMHDLGGEG